MWSDVRFPAISPCQTASALPEVYLHKWIALLMLGKIFNRFSISVTLTAQHLTQCLQTREFRLTKKRRVIRL